MLLCLRLKTWHPGDIPAFGVTGSNVWRSSAIATAASDDSVIADGGFTAMKCKLIAKRRRTAELIMHAHRLSVSTCEPQEAQDAPS